MKILKLMSIMIIIILTGCTSSSNSPKVKQLSVKQIEYFDSAIEITALQSEALILATEKLIAQAKNRVDLSEEIRRVSAEKAMQRTLSGKDAREVASRLSRVTMEAVENRRKLDENLEKITRKTRELNTYLQKMKEIQVAMDAYIVSEKSGEAVVENSYYTIENMIRTVNDMTPKIRREIKEILVILNEIEKIPEIQNLVDEKEEA
ncbi:hypothetical protein PM10SUCC1_34070 [Propionigenium maris DSM 9537]|uniref:Lipoprotein n=1 Tax=Propionigenium maris DSM 9537 TaxID=1123000 RepID=A0A9W6GMN5_9FUSO|nr:hypothetical protein [Propionigenium maris]GLI57893.1 hypothetical protein PM10SUCC1_34070 [Propionigenium maris DSM 9537]